MRRVFRIPFLRDRHVRDVDDELAFHLETRVERLIAQGMTPDDARREALRQFGDIAGVRDGMLALDRQRDAAERRATMFADALQDVAFGVRAFRRNLSFTVLVVGALALGIGANAAIYSVINALLINKLPVEKPDELVAVGEPSNAESFGSGTPTGRMFSYLLYRDVREQNRVFTGVLASGRAGRLDVDIDRAASREVEHPAGRFVSGNYFSVLGVRAAVGRTLDASSDEEGAAPQATISYGYWTRRFNNDSSIVGRSIVVNGVRMTITGVAARGFAGEIVGVATDIWLPVSTYDLLRPHDLALEERRIIWLQLIGRLKPGVTIAQARAHLGPLVTSNIVANASATDAARLAKFPPETPVSSGARGLSVIRDEFAMPLVALMVGVSLLLCIVCVNVANLLLARGVARQREMSLRLAIGANRWRIVRQMLAESLLLALASGAAAVVIGWWGSAVLLALASEGKPIAINVAPSARVVFFTFALSLTSVVLFGLVPALRTSRVDLATSLRAHSRSLTARARFGILLIISQAALSLVLLAGASMLTRALRAAESRDLGFDRDHLIAADLDVALRRYDVDRVANYAAELRDRVAAIPGVAAVTYSENGLFQGSDWSSSIDRPGLDPNSEDARFSNDDVGPDYAKGIGGRLIAGRDFAKSDESLPTVVALVNKSFADFYFPSRSAVGQIVRTDGPAHVEIVGVISDVHANSVEVPVGRRARRMYFPFVRREDPSDLPEALRLLVRTTGDPSALLPEIRRAIVSVDKTVVLDDIRPLSQLVSASIRERRLVAQIATGLGVLALLLAAIGLYGVTSYTIARRTNEIGVRVALGASASDVAGTVLGGALRPVVIGIVVGIPLAIVGMRLLAAYLPHLQPPDAASVAAAVGVLIASAFAAAAAPARRATRIDPVTALREE